MTTTIPAQPPVARAAHRSAKQRELDELAAYLDEVRRKERLDLLREAAGLAQEEG